MKHFTKTNRTAPLGAVHRSRRSCRSGAAPTAAIRLRTKGILVPVDFSSRSILALRFAINIARDSNLPLTLVHVIEPRLYEIFSNPAVFTGKFTFVENVTAKLLELARREAPHGMAVKHWIQVGNPSEEIVAAAEVLKSDLIVIASHGHSGFPYVLMGSTAERVVRHSPCPVLVLPKLQQELAPKKGDL